MIEIKELTYRISVFSLKDVNITIGDGEYFIVLGPTGAGKTILLECLAVLHHVKQGQILVDGRDITHLAPAPHILLLDEPLSNLDLQTSKYLRLELKHIHHDLGFSTLHVTHNQIEAEEMADRIAILSSGILEQVGKPQEVFFSPRNETVSQFIGALNILKCRACRNLNPGLTEVDCNGMSIILPHDEGPV
jgi:ABC-type Fe3+/spermidine/putrescine transport system ATPase subunit